MKNILEVFGEPISYGGEESYVMTTLRNMNWNDLHIDCLTPYYCENEQFVNFISQHSGNIYSLNVPFKPTRSRHNLIKLFRNFFKNHQYDIVHIHSGSISALAYGAMAASKSGIKKVIVHAHISGLKENLKHSVIKAYMGVLLKKYATIFCACSELAARWEFPQEIAEKKTIILKNGVDLDHYSFNADIREKMRIKFKIDPEEFVIGHVGRFSHEKNQKFLVYILKRLNEEKKKVKLVFVGSGKQLNQVEKKVHEFNLQNKVIFTGVVNNVSDYMQMFDICVLPSLFEGFPLVGIEALASGLPLITSMVVPESICLTNNVLRLPLEQGVDKWATSISEFIGQKRNDNRSIIQDHGYDIQTTARMVRGLYSS